MNCSQMGLFANLGFVWFVFFKLRNGVRIQMLVFPLLIFHSESEIKLNTIQIWYLIGQNREKVRPLRPRKVAQLIFPGRVPKCTSPLCA